MNRILLFVIISLLVLGLLGEFTGVAASLTRYSTQLIAVAENIGIILMLVNGTFMNTRLFKIACFFISLAVLGFVFKIMHLPGADQLLLYPFIVVFALYLVHFVNKKSKTRTDVFKVVMLATFLVIPPAAMLHVISDDQRVVLLAGTHIIFWVTFLDFLYTSRKTVVY